VVADKMRGSRKEAPPAVLIESFINIPLVTLESHTRAEQAARWDDIVATLPDMSDIKTRECFLAS
jgi:hypothetical protein